MTNKYPKLNDREWLYNKYIIDKLSTYQIGDMLNTSNVTIGSALKRHSIPVRNGIKYPILYNKKWLHQKYIKETLSIGKIAKLIGTHKNNIKDKLIKYDIKVRKPNERVGNAHKRKSYIHPHLNDRDWLHYKYIVQGLSIKNIKELVNAKESNSVRQSLIRHNIPVRNISDGLTYRRNDDYFIFDEEVINGCLLGDASLGIHNKKSDISVPYFHKKNIHWEHIVFVASKLFSQNVGSRIKFCINLNKKLKSGKHPQSYYLRSLSHKELVPLYKKWYPKWNNYVKVVPEDLNITPTVLLHWFMDDGNAYQRRVHSKTKQIHITLCTECFTETDHEFLRDIINNNFNLHAKIRKYHQGTGFRLHINQKYVPSFYEIIGKSPVKSMEYKWK